MALLKKVAHQLHWRMEGIDERLSRFAKWYAYYKLYYTGKLNEKQVIRKLLLFPCEARILWWFSEKMIIETIPFQNKEIDKMQALNDEKKEQLYTHLAFLDRITYCSIINLYINEVDTHYNKREIREEQGMEVDITSYETFKNGLLEKAEEHIQKIRDIMRK